MRRTEDLIPALCFVYIVVKYVDLIMWLIFHIDQVKVHISNGNYFQWSNLEMKINKTKTEYLFFKAHAYFVTVDSKGRS